MMTITAIARVISVHTGVADVERWAAAPHDAVLYPGLDESATPETCAMLLLTVTAAPASDQAPAAVATVQGARSKSGPQH